MRTVSQCLVGVVVCSGDEQVEVRQVCLWMVRGCREVIGDRRIAGRVKVYKTVVI